MRIFLTSTILFFSLTLLGQTEVVNFSLGLHRSNAFVSDFHGTKKGRSNFTIGIGYESQSKKGFCFSPSLYYLRKSIKFYFVDEPVESDYVISRSIFYRDYYYLSIPVKGGFRKGEKISFFGNIGIVPSILLFARGTSGFFGDRTTPVNITSSVNAINLGGILESGIDMNLTDRVLASFAINYQPGITVFDRKDLHFRMNNMRHSGLSFLIGINFILSKNKNAVQE